MDELIAACRHALQNNLGLQPDEKVLVVTDENKMNIGKAFVSASRAFGNHVRLVEIPVPAANGTEPPSWAADEMLQAEVILMPVTRSLSWTRARMAATAGGARIASMAGGLDEAMMLRLFTIDYEPIRKRANLLADLLDKAKEVHLCTKLGSDLRFSVAGRKSHGRKGGIYREPGSWGNLPCGEAFIAPVEGTAHGIYAVDASHAGVGRLNEPICIEVESGLACGFSGGPEAGFLKKHLQQVGSPQAFNIAEFGIGCNDKAVLTGATIEDEKVLGTCHLALGNNVHFGGEVEVAVHVDGIITAPTISLDGYTIISGGELVAA